MVHKSSTYMCSINSTHAFDGSMDHVLTGPHLVESITPLVRPTVRRSEDASNSSLHHRYVNPNHSYYFADHCLLSNPPTVYVIIRGRQQLRSSKSTSRSRTRTTPATSAATILGTLGTGITNSARIVVTGRTFDIFLGIIAKWPENVPSEPVFERRATTSTSRVHKQFQRRRTMPDERQTEQHTKGFWIRGRALLPHLGYRGGQALRYGRRRGIRGKERDYGRRSCVLLRLQTLIGLSWSHWGPWGRSDGRLKRRSGDDRMFLRCDSRSSASWTG